MKRIAILICFAGLASVASAQLITGTNGLTIKSGTPFYLDGLLLLPNVDLTFQNDTVSKSVIPLAVGTGNSITRVYTIAPSLTVSGTVGIRYAAAELNGNTEGTMSVVNAAPGAGFLGVPGLASANGTYTVYGLGVANLVLNRVTATSAGVPLAIQYHGFEATAGPSCSVLLSWHADLAQPDNFQVERSRDGKIFRALPAGTSQSGARFSSTDAAPLPGRNIYRLAIREEGKPVLYSTAIDVNSPCEAAGQMKIYPNPAGGSVTVALAYVPGGTTFIDLVDISGKLIKTFYAAGQVSTLDLQGITAGSYFIRVQNGTTTESMKFIKL